MTLFGNINKKGVEIADYSYIFNCSILILAEYLNAIVMEVGVDRAQHLNYNQFYNFLFNFIHAKVKEIFLNEKGFLLNSAL